MKLKGVKVILGVTGSIAAYKAVLLLRLLIKDGAKVKVVLTPDAHKFVGALTFATLSGEPALSDFYDSNNHAWNQHVELGLWADILILAPLTANTLSKCANGLCDNFLMAVYMSARCPILMTPAMDLDMYQHFSTQRNLACLKENGTHIMEPRNGELASGLTGQGRLPEPEEIIEEIKVILGKDNHWVNKKVVITSGPTQEDIDPVRYISNHSSGKMGLALAKTFRYKGADVHLISGSGSLPDPDGVSVYHVRTAQQMADQLKKIYPNTDVIIFAAAVADYKPSVVSDIKIKKNTPNLHLDLEKNIDIASYFGQNKKAGAIHVGFALETNQEEKNAKSKLERKNFDLIVLNSLQDKGAGFRYDTNKVKLFYKNGMEEAFPLKTKEEVAEDIIEAVKRCMK